MPEVDYKELKKGGFMKQVQKDLFSMRLRVIGGRVDGTQLKKIYEIAEKYGRGYIHLTSRQSIEIPFVNIKDIDAIKKEMAKAGVQMGACGPRVRTVTACQGSAVCSSGLIDTTELAYELDNKYYGKDLPGKFKIGITGCGNNCLKAEENDIGIKGGIKPEWDSESCSFCGLCQAVCPTGAIKIDDDKNNIVFDEEKCVYCGKCVKNCPQDAWKGENGYLLFFGGTFGSKIHIGRQIFHRVYNRDEVIKAVDFTIQFFKDHGKQSDRFFGTLERTGWNVFKEELGRFLDGRN